MDLSQAFGLTNKIISKFLRKSGFYTIFPLAIDKNKSGLRRCVSDAETNARTQMAQAKRASKIFGAVTGATLATAAVFAPVAAAAQEVATVTVPTHEEQREQYRQARHDAAKHAIEHGVAIILHVGMDIQSHEQPEALLAWVQNEFRTKFTEHGINVGVFPSMNDAPGTGLVYRVGDHLYSPEGADPLLNLKEADRLVPEVAEQGRLALGLPPVQRVSVEDAPSPRS